MAADPVEERDLEKLLTMLDYDRVIEKFSKQMFKKGIKIELDAVALVAVLANEPSFKDLVKSIINKKEDSNNESKSA